MNDIKETKEALSWIFDTTDAIRSAAADGKVTIADAPKFWGPLMGSGKAIGGIDKIPTELKELTQEQLDELVTMVKDRFDISDDKLEGLIENILNHAVNLASNIAAVYQLKK